MAWQEPAANRRKGRWGVMQSNLVDLLIVGGGINGVGIARDAAGRGLSVLLCEKDDLAQGTSSRSGKLVHGGLRYLEYYEFRLVREALIEREVLFCARRRTSSGAALRAAALAASSDRLDDLARIAVVRPSRGSKAVAENRGASISRMISPARQSRPEFRTGFEYSDCWVDDARLVVLNALDAAARNARILTRTALVAAVAKMVPGEPNCGIRRESSPVCQHVVS